MLNCAAPPPRAQIQQSQITMGIGRTSNSGSQEPISSVSFQAVDRYRNRANNVAISIQLRHQPASKNILPAKVRWIFVVNAQAAQTAANFVGVLTFLNSGEVV